MDDSMGNEGGDGEVAEDDSARNGRAASQSALPALWFNFWRQLKSDADRGKSGINEADPEPFPPRRRFADARSHSRGESSLIGCH